MNDIPFILACPSSQPGTVLCQVKLNLTDHGKLDTELRFKQTFSKAIDDGKMSFPHDSGIVYSHSSSNEDAASKIIIIKQYPPRKKVKTTAAVATISSRCCCWCPFALL
jgi:hypothetical protein